jgi:GAF domain-containing protein
MTKVSSLISSVVEFAESLVENFDIIEVLTVLSSQCVEVMDVDAAGVILAGPDGELQLIASSSTTVHELEMLQLELDEGPCVDAFRTGLPVWNHAFSDPDARWPQFAPRALAMGYHSVYGIPMVHRGVSIGALNLFRRVDGDLDTDTFDIAQGFAQLATIAILQQQKLSNATTLNAQLTTALNSRIIIEQAKGKLSHALDCDMDTAFNRLRSHARNNNLRITDLARAISFGDVDCQEIGVSRVKHPNATKTEVVEPLRASA